MFCYVCFLGGLLCFGVLFFGVFLVFWYLGTPQEVEAMCADRKKFESETDGELLNVAVYMGNDQIYHIFFYFIISLFLHCRDIFFSSGCD